MKDIVATKFTTLALHMLAVCISIYARDSNVSSALPLDVNLSIATVDSYRRQWAISDQDYQLSRSRPRLRSRGVLLLAFQLHDSEPQAEHHQ